MGCHQRAQDTSVDVYVKQLGKGGAAGHGFDGSGNPVLGAPSLVDDISLYGDGDEALRARLRLVEALEERRMKCQIRMLVALLTRNLGSADLCDRGVSPSPVSPKGFIFFYVLGLLRIRLGGFLCDDCHPG